LNKTGRICAFENHEEGTQSAAVEIVLVKNFFAKNQKTTGNGCSLFDRDILLISLDESDAASNYLRLGADCDPKRNHRLSIINAAIPL
jgi:hypothetical protein